MLRRSTAFGSLVALGALPSWAQSNRTRPAQTLSGDHIKLSIGHAALRVDGRQGHAVAINGTVPGPLIRLREGQDVTISVTNNLDEDTSIHWHGLLVPFHMDGVPGVSFPGIKPGETFDYRFKVRQAGTYWYHSHSGLQELEGHYAPMVIDPAGPEPAPYDREHVVVLSDYSFIHPHVLLQRLKQQPGFFNRQKQTIAGLLAGRDQPLAERLEWARMRMDPTDIADVTGAAYTYLINGHGPQDNWTGLFAPGERVRLRIVNAAAMTIFNVRIPGLPMTVVQADGQDVAPVVIDELQIANAETYDVIVTPPADHAYTLVAEASDRSGLARATLAPRAGMTAAVPPLRERPLLTMRDMGMDHAAGGHSHAGHGGDPASPVKIGPGVQMVSPAPADRVGDRGAGLERVAHRVLTYADLVALHPNPDPRTPSRSLDVHLTGNMERFIWGFDGLKFSQGAPPYPFRLGERVRVNLINDTMMAHPIHLHGHFFEVVNGHAGRHPRKHTVNVLPGGKVSFDLTADEPGDWAFHCHMLLHMHAGMFRVVTVRPLEGASQ
jgi:FtsP/CotA-like multicopper oxidase with cupredoxin domain